MVPPEFGPRIGPHSNPVTAGEPAGHCLPAAYGRLPSTAARALHRPAPLFGRGSGVLLPVTACFIGGYSTTFLRLRQGVGGGFFCRCRQGGLLDRRRLEPAPWFPARLRAGARLSPEKAGGKSAGGKPPGPPSFMARSLLARSFWGLCHIVPVVRLFRCPCTCPDLGAFFWKMLLEHIFLENAFQIGLSIPEEIASLLYQK